MHIYGLRFVTNFKRSFAVDEKVELFDEINGGERGVSASTISRCVAGEIAISDKITRTLY